MTKVIEELEEIVKEFDLNVVEEIEFDLAIPGGRIRSKLG